MKIKNILFTTLTLALLLSSCYKDLGNYDYDESIETASLNLEKKYFIKKKKGQFTYKIDPEVQYNGDEKALKYEWYAASVGSSKGELIGTEKDLTLNFDEQKGLISTDKSLLKSYYLRLYITDTATNVVTMKYTTISLVEPYTACWLVLHEKDSHAELGTISYLDGEYEVLPDAYSKETGITLSGKPEYIGVRQIPNGWTASHWLYHINTQVYLSTSDKSEGGLISPGDLFERKSSWDKILNNVQLPTYDPSKMYGSGGGDRGYAMASNGKIFATSTYTTAMYEVVPNTTEISGPVDIKGLTVGMQGVVAYDDAGKRFVQIDMTEHSWKEQIPKPIAESPKFGTMRYDANNAADPSNIPATHVPVSMFTGYKYGSAGIAPWAQYQAYAYFIDGDKSHVYTIRGREITMAFEPPISGHYVFDIPEGMTTETPMSTGFGFANIIFYASGNKVYKHNVANGEYKVIYTHDDPNAEAADVRMAIEGYNTDEVYKNMRRILTRKPEMTLAVGFNIGNQGEVVVLTLDTSGDLETQKSRYDIVEVHKGFGKIKNIRFI